MANGNIQVETKNCDTYVVVYTGGPVTNMLCTPENKHIPQFVALKWVDRDHEKGYHRQVSVYLQKGEVELLRDLLTEELQNMGE